MGDKKRFDFTNPFKSFISSYLGFALKMVDKMETSTLCKYLSQIQQQFEKFMDDFKVRSFYCYKESGKTICEFEIEAPFSSTINKKTVIIKVETSGSLIFKCEKT